MTSTQTPANLLLLDIGNTNIHYAWLPSGNLASKGFISEKTDYGKAFANLLTMCGNKIRQATILVSQVQPPIYEDLANIIENHGLKAPLVCNPLVVNAYAQKHGLTFANYHFLGSDLFCDIIASAKKGAVVIDAGTALKVLALDKDGVFVGGAIVPGLELMRTSLYDHTQQAKLPELFLPQDLLALSTEGAIAAGIVYGSAVLAWNLALKACEKLHLAAADIILTGGDSDKLLTALQKLGSGKVNVEPDLTLKGLALAFNRQAVL